MGKKSIHPKEKVLFDKAIKNVLNLLDGTKLSEFHVNTFAILPGKDKPLGWLRKVKPFLYSPLNSIHKYNYQSTFKHVDQMLTK